MSDVRILRTATERGGLKLMRTDTLEVEFVRMKVDDTFHIFNYRILKPFPTSWRPDTITSVQILGEGFEPFVKRKAREMFVNLLHMSDPDNLKKHLPWLFEITKVKLSECVIVPKLEDVGPPSKEAVEAASRCFVLKRNGTPPSTAGGEVVDAEGWTEIRLGGIEVAQVGSLEEEENPGAAGVLVEALALPIAEAMEKYARERYTR